jgi:transposase-like protein
VPGKNPKRYSPEFKEEAAKMVVDSSRPIAAVAREIGVNDTTLGFWVKAYRKKRTTEELPLDMPDRARLRELERRNRELEMENTFLKKAAAYFAREHR